MDSTPHTERVRQVRLESEKRLVRWCTTLFVLPSVAFAVTDRLLAPDAAHLMRLYALRAALLVLWAGGLLVLRPLTTHEQVRRLVVGLSLGLVLFTLALHAARPPDNTLIVRAEVLVTFFLFVIYPNRLALQAAPAAVMMAGSLSLLQWYNRASGTDLYSAASNLVFAAMLGAVVSHNRGSLEEDLSESLDRERAAIEERERAAAALRSLEGIIPICSYCHQVRTEAGAWTKLDHYVRERTDADFSHGMCPNCIAEHHPELGALDERHRPTS